jgi:hypothetical protein
MNTLSASFKLIDVNSKTTIPGVLICKPSIMTEQNVTNARIAENMKMLTSFSNLLKSGLIFTFLSVWSTIALAFYYHGFRE